MIREDMVIYLANCWCCSTMMKRRKTKTAYWPNTLKADMYLLPSVGMYCLSTFLRRKVSVLS